MKLVMLGTGGYFPNDRRHTACLMLPELGVVLDAGSGMFRVSKYLATDRLDVFLSHAHLDHVIGLTCLLGVLPAEMFPHVTIHGEEAKLAAMRDHLFAETIFPVLPPFRMQPLGDENPLPGGGSLTHFPLRHPGGARGFRLEWPERSMAYVTDTTAAADADYVDRIRGVDLLVHEAYFAERDDDLPDITGHSRLADVARVAREADVGLLVLVHLDPLMASDDVLDLDGARTVFANTYLGSDGMELGF